MKDKRHGFGTLKLATGETYESDWVNDMKSGKGFIVQTNGKKVACTFHNDLVINLGK